MKRAILPPHLLAVLLIAGGVAIVSLFIIWRGTDSALRLDDVSRSAALGATGTVGMAGEGATASNQDVTHARAGQSLSLGTEDSQKAVLSHSSSRASDSGVSADEGVSLTQGPTVITNMPIPAAYGNSQVLSTFSSADQEEIQEIGSNFTATIESSGVSPDSPEYMQIWNKALREADDSFRAQFGIEAFEAMQMSQGEQ